MLPRLVRNEIVGGGLGGHSKGLLLFPATGQKSAAQPLSIRWEDIYKRPSHQTWLATKLPTLGQAIRWLEKSLVILARVKCAQN